VLQQMNRERFGSGTVGEMGMDNRGGLWSFWDNLTNTGPTGVRISDSRISVYGYQMLVWAFRIH